MTPIPESSPVVETKTDPVSALCQELSAGLSLLTNYPDPFAQPITDSDFTTSSASHTNPALASPTSGKCN